MADKSAANIEDQQLRMKFRSLTYTSPKRQQKLREVEPERAEHQKDSSYRLWKRINPGYFDGDNKTTTRDMQQYDENDFKLTDKTCFRQKDRHTEFVEYVVRDKALARKGN